jgi:hypothetical protein
MVTNTKASKFFDNEEISKLMPYISGELRFNPQVAKQLAKEMSRSTYSVYTYVRKQKTNYKQLGRITRKYKKRVKTDLTKSVDKLTVNKDTLVKYGEFIIPINSFELRTDNGSTSLVLKFEKSF